MPTTLSFTHTLSPHLTHYFIRDLGTLLLGIPYHTCNATKVARETNVFLCMCFFSKLWWSACGSASIFHTRLRLDFSALNYHLCRKIVVFSGPACALCDASIEDMKHYFLYSPSFAALRDKLFVPAAQLLGWQIAVCLR